MSSAPPPARRLPLSAVQAAALPIGTSLDVFAADVARVLAAAPTSRLVAYPELHLFGPAGSRDDADPAVRTRELQAAAQPLDGELCRGLGEIAADLGIWLVPGSICERGPAGELFNTAVAFSPDGEPAAAYRKIFPWRPYEPYDPGDRFVVLDLPGIGRLGLDICYDAWFPEVSRHLAWLGADVILNVVRTTTPDRAQELVLARANAIVNQVFVVSVNCAGPDGTGRSIVVDPEGAVLLESTDASPTTLSLDLDLVHVDRVHETGTAGLNRLWAQFGAADRPIDLPLYRGRIDPATWPPHRP